MSGSLLHLFPTFRVTVLALRFASDFRIYHYYYRLCGCGFSPHINRQANDSRSDSLSRFALSSVSASACSQQLPPCSLCVYLFRHRIFSYLYLFVISTLFQKYIFLCACHDRIYFIRNLIYDSSTSALPYAN